MEEMVVRQHLGMPLDTCARQFVHERMSMPNTSFAGEPGLYPYFTKGARYTGPKGSGWYELPYLDRNGSTQRVYMVVGRGTVVYEGKTMKATRVGWSLSLYGETGADVEWLAAIVCDSTKISVRRPVGPDPTSSR